MAVPTPLRRRPPPPEIAWGRWRYRDGSEHDHEIPVAEFHAKFEHGVPDGPAILPPGAVCISTFLGLDLRAYQHGDAWEDAAGRLHVVCHDDVANVTSQIEVPPAQRVRPGQPDEAAVGPLLGTRTDYPGLWLRQGQLTHDRGR